MERVIEYSGGRVVINIKSPGIYSLGIESSTGKSHLFHLLQRVPNDTIYTMTYDKNVKRTIEELAEFINSNIPVLYIDRFDMVISEDIVRMLKSVNNRYIILDYKDDDYNELLDANYAVLLKRKEGFKIYA